MKHLLTVFFAFLILSCTISGNFEGSITNGDLKKRIEQNDAPIVLDVRSSNEYASGHVPGAIHFPVSQAAQNIDLLEQYKGQEIVLYCERGVRASKVSNLLNENGFSKLIHLTGDMPGWRNNKFPIER